MRILVTGADGFVGRHAVLRLVRSGHEVIAATQRGVELAGATPARFDVRDHHVVLRAFQSSRPQAILHLAGIAFVPDARRDPLGAFETNATGALSVMLAAAESVPDARVVVISSAEVYGPVEGDRPIGEDRPAAPVTVYGASKASAEHLARALAADGLDAVVLRPFNHIGPGQSERFAVASFARQVARLEAKEGDGVLRHGNLEAVRDFLDVRDVVRAYELALTAPPGRLRPGAPYNVCSGRGTPIRTIVDMLVRAARRPIRCEVDPARLRPVDVPAFVGDPTLFREAVGFEPEIPLEQTLSDVLDEARADLEGRGRQGESAT